jgi:DNA-binding MarR family transcriptional regulator
VSGEVVVTTAGERIFTEFRHVIASVVLFNDRVAQATGMSASESQFVHLLELHGSMTPSELASRSGLTSGTVTGVVDRLEALRFVRREPHPHDRRKIVVVLDEAQVADTLAPMYADRAATMREVVGRLSSAEQEAVVRFLSLLNGSTD